MSKQRSAFRNWVEYITFRVVSGVAAALPWRAAWHFGKLLGEFMHAVSPHRRNVARQNLAAAFPEKPTEEIHRLARKVYHHLGLLVVETLRVPQMLQQGIEKYVDPPDLAPIRQELEEGRPIIVVTAHIGSWEIAGHTCSRMVVPLNSVARPLDNPFLEKYLAKQRELSGQRMIGKRGAVRDMVQTIKSGGSVAILLDQDARRSGIFINFFGRPASTWPTPAALALKLGCTIVFGFVRRQPDRFHYNLILDSVFRPESTGNREGDVLKLTQQMTDRLESCIRECPEQWFWVHRRWKTRPLDELQQKS